MSVALHRSTHIPTSISDIPLVAPLTSGDGDEGTPEYVTVDDKWGT